MARLRTVVEDISRVAIPVFICGETGTGKEVLANYIHQISPWREGPFLKVNCAAIPRDLIESELFGSEAGAFTGASTSKRGLFELAHSGTLLLDHISECDLGLQAKLLQFLQDGTYRPVGGSDERRVSTRVICLANVLLEQEIKRGRFREDLFHRIAGITLHMPSLKDRLEDLPGIAKYLLRLFAVSFKVEPVLLSRDLNRRLLRYRWPGNIRELENVLRRYILLRTPDALIEGLKLRPVPMLASRDFQLGGTSTFKTRTRQLIKQAEAIAILDALEQHGWNRASSARSLNISLRGLLYKMRSAGISDGTPERNAQGDISIDPPDASAGGS
jgi:two-component system response regulator AtoC